VNPKTIKAGTKVFYYSSPQNKFEATIASFAWQLADGTWVVRLEGLGDDYKKYCNSEKTHVSAAAIRSLKERV
jgi:hypothetical protein